MVIPFLLRKEYDRGTPPVRRAQEFAKVLTPALIHTQKHLALSEKDFGGPPVTLIIVCDYESVEPLSAHGFLLLTTKIKG
jgi:hypothetical protein